MSEDPIRRQYIDGSSYPPSRTGLRGSHPGSFDVAHEIRDGRRFDVEGLPVEESYDLVVVGAGISGLASAWFFRRAHPDEPAVAVDPATDHVLDAVRALSPKRRAVVVLRFYEDLSIDQIAEVLRTRPGTVKSLLHRALKDLEKVVER